MRAAEIDSIRETNSLFMRTKHGKVETTKAKRWQKDKKTHTSRKGMKDRAGRGQLVVDQRKRINQKKSKKTHQLNVETKDFKKVNILKTVTKARPIIFEAGKKKQFEKR